VRLQLSGSNLTRGFTFLLLAAGIGFTVAAPRAEPQASVEIGVAPDRPFGYYDTAPYNCAPNGYYGRNGSTGMASLALARGFMARAASMAM
jgi:hypothetical protein